MLPRRPDCGGTRTGSGSVVNFRTAGTDPSGSARRGSAVLPSVLTFLVIVASGGLLLMIEKGMLSGVETPAPRGDGQRPSSARRPGERPPGPAADDVDSQVRKKSGGGEKKKKKSLWVEFFCVYCFTIFTKSVGTKCSD
ncbi:Carbohydrate sulfotransferase 14 [Liparis tanakae]|uniref:Carbohydrate sulfotransferase 14 n=1 Tax=Liparis tanakae TaxID=230148 RepID=A0A4Z2FFL9_9TELE|nr:Carbohydrate sulfotransferase 14 [Liparis tanakae]